VLSTLAAIAGIASTIFGVVGAARTARNEAARQRYVGLIALRNVQIAEQEAVREEELAHIAAGEKEQEGVRARKLMRAQLASRGVAVNVGTGIDDQFLVVELAKEAAKALRFQGAERARARIAQAAGYSEQAFLAGLSEENAKTKGHFDAAGILIEDAPGLLTNLRTVSEKWGVFST